MHKYSATSSLGAHTTPMLQAAAAKSKAPSPFSAVSAIDTEGDLSAVASERVTDSMPQIFDRLQSLRRMSIASYALPNFGQSPSHRSDPYSNRISKIIPTRSDPKTFIPSPEEVVIPQSEEPNMSVPVQRVLDSKKSDRGAAKKSPKFTTKTAVPPVREQSSSSRADTIPQRQTGYII